MSSKHSNSFPLKANEPSDNSISRVSVNKIIIGHMSGSVSIACGDINWHWNLVLIDITFSIFKDGFTK